MSEQSSTVKILNHGVTGLSIHLAGLVIGFVSIGLVLAGALDIESGLAMLAPFADMLFGLGLVIVVALASRSNVPMKHLIVAGIAIGLGLFYKSAPHEIHIASGIGFGLPHNGHTVVGTILITLSVVALAVLAYVHSRSSRSKQE